MYCIKEPKNVYKIITYFNKTNNSLFYLHSKQNLKNDFTKQSVMVNVKYACEF